MTMSARAAMLPTTGAAIHASDDVLDEGSPELLSTAAASVDADGEEAWLPLVLDNVEVESEDGRVESPFSGVGVTGVVPGVGVAAGGVAPSGLTLGAATPPSAVPGAAGAGAGAGAAVAPLGGVKNTTPPGLTDAGLAAGGTGKTETPDPVPGAGIGAGAGTPFPLPGGSPTWIIAESMPRSGAIALEFVTAVLR